MFESELFRKKIYCIAESTCNIVGIIGVPHSDLATEELHPTPYPPFVTPLLGTVM